MTPSTAGDVTVNRPLRLWPGLVLVAIQWLLWLGARFALPDGGFVSILGGAAGFLAVMLWWLFGSRAPWVDRVGVIVVMVLAVVATRRIVHPSIANGLMGMMIPIFALPALSLALVAGAAAGRRLPDGPRRAILAAAIVLACGVFALLRTGGITGDANADLHWRWTPTAEERMLAQEPAAPPSPVASPVVQPPAAIAETKAPPIAASATATPAPMAAERGRDWPGFRGPRRDGAVRGTRIKPEWASAPVELWRRPIGPAWSSFAVHGDRLYTQEQRGEEEVVASYDLKTGAPVWRHGDKARFYESNGGAGPRGTPTLADGRVYTLGGTGIVNALDAGTGTVAWSHNAAADTGAETPMWGFSSSPLVIGDVVIVAASGSLVAYDRATGERRWLGPTGGGASYSSPHLTSVDGVPQVLMLSAVGLISVAPADGKQLWQHAWKGYPIVQPALTPDGNVLISVSDSSGTRRLAVAHAGDKWTVDERWTSIGLKPYFNDFVVHEGHAYGFDGRILSCIDLADGARKWKGGRYGSGQLILLPDEDLLLVLSEDGEVALVDAIPGAFNERAKFKALEGKTWNHPVLAGDVLLVRNGEEMAAFRLP